MRRRIGLAFLCAVVAACGGGSAPASTSAPADSVARIVDGARLRWDQTADTAEQLASLRFVVYVDGVQADVAGMQSLQDVSCETKQGSAGFACSARLPPMAPGRHTIQLASRTGGDGSRQSTLSEPMNIEVGNPATPGR